MGNYLCGNTFELSVQCFLCAKFSYVESPNEIALSNDKGVVENLEDFISFGGDMEPSNEEERAVCLVLWKKICQEKISEAYLEYKQIQDHK